MAITPCAPLSKYFQRLERISQIRAAGQGQVAAAADELKFGMGKQNSLPQPLRRSLVDEETLSPVIRFLFNPLRDKMSPVCRPFHTGLDNRTSIRRPVAGDHIQSAWNCPGE